MKRLLFLLPLLAACSSSPGAAESASSSDALRATVDGPMRLRGACTLDGLPTALPVVYAGPDSIFGSAKTASSVAPRPGPHDWVSFQMELVPAGDGFTVTVATMLNHLWSLPAPRVTVTKDGLHAHDTVSLHDDTTVPGRAIDCTATLKPQPMAMVSAPIASDEITTPVASFDLPLPNRLTCGLAMKFASPITPYLVEHLDQVVRVSAHGLAVSTSQADDRTIVFRVLDAHGWDVFLQMEGVDEDGSIAGTIRRRIGQPAQFENVRCPSK